MLFRQKKDIITQMSINRGSKEFLWRFKAALAANCMNMADYARKHEVSLPSIWQYAKGVRKSKNFFPKMVEFVEQYEKSLSERRVG